MFLTTGGPFMRESNELSEEESKKAMNDLVKDLGIGDDHKPTLVEEGADIIMGLVVIMRKIIGHVGVEEEDELLALSRADFYLGKLEGLRRSQPQAK